MTNQHPDISCPTACHICGFHATGIGLGLVGRDKDPQWICAPCSLLIEDIRKVKRMDAYEIKAIEMVDDLAGEFCAELGRTDMAEMSELERRMLWKTVWKGCAESLRGLIRSNGAPF